MDHRRLIDILGELTDTGRDGLASRLCGLCSDVLDITGAGVMLMDGDALPVALCSSDTVAAGIEDLHSTLGEGPGYDAHRDGVAVVEPDLAEPRTARWPAFSPMALEAGAAGLFSFPLRVGGVRLGALTFHRSLPGPLTDDQYFDAIAMAEVVVNAMLARQAEAPPGALASELEELTQARAEVHQATGMVSVQLEIAVSEALVRLRAHAYSEGRTLGEVAADVVARRLRLSP